MKENRNTPPAEDELKRWLDAISKGDQYSFTLLLRHYWNKVYTQALTYLKSAELAQEVTQDVFLKIWSTKEKLPALDHFPDYLFILSRNAIISALRKKGRETSLPSDELEEALLRPDRQLNYKESYNNILGLIEQLPPTRKKVFIMSRFEGRSYEEIGAQLGISRNGVKDHIIKTLNFLRIHFQLNEEKLLLFVLATIAFFL